MAPTSMSGWGEQLMGGRGLGGSSPRDKCCWLPLRMGKSRATPWLGWLQRQDTALGEMQG